jgi:hypothetical protein
MFALSLSYPYTLTHAPTHPHTHILCVGVLVGSVVFLDHVTHKHTHTHTHRQTHAFLIYMKILLFDVFFLKKIILSNPLFLCVCVCVCMYVSHERGETSPPFLERGFCILSLSFLFMSDLILFTHTDTHPYTHTHIPVFFQYCAPHTARRGSANPSFTSFILATSYMYVCVCVCVCVQVSKCEKEKKKNTHIYTHTHTHLPMEVCRIGAQSRLLIGA